jgi:glycosyltransferase involved in cell wall biosynthesis
MILSIIVPVYNEEKTLLKSLKSVRNLNTNLCKHEIIVINDGSKDNSGKILNENKNLYDKLLVNESNKGKGYSIKRGLLECKGTHVIFHDSDLEYDPKDISKFEKIFSDFDADGILGSRFNYSDYTRSHNILNKFANYFITLAFNFLYNTTFTDIYSCYFAFKKELLNPNQLQTSGFEQHAEILCKVIKRGEKFYEVPINYNGRSYKEGKKIRSYDFFFVVFQIFLRRFF